MTNILVGVKSIAVQLGFMGIEVADGETPDEAADRFVRDILTQVVQEGREIYPLQTVGFALKEQYGARIYDGALARTGALVDELRAAAAEAAPSAPVEAPDSVAPDTTGVEG